MSDRRPACVVTTIQTPTPAVRQFAEVLAEAGFGLVVVGDRKGPSQFSGVEGTFLTIEDQLDLSLQLARKLPENHYARKNLGYLVAIGDGAPSLYETDDDNAQLESWCARSENAHAEPVDARTWVNVYRVFNPSPVIWPRGFPLDLVTDPNTFDHEPTNPVEVVAPIQQGLANGSPDVDAVWRLVSNTEHTFTKRASIWLPKGTWSPFNSQSTWWWPEAYPLLYLPSFCSFRMTDIWRSFVAQRCLWEMSFGLVVHGAEVLQQRNDHNLMRDFEDEIPGYLGNARLCSMLAALELHPGPSSTGENLRLCYQGLVGAGFVPEDELALVDAWLEDLKMIGR